MTSSYNICRIFLLLSSLSHLGLTAILYSFPFFRADLIPHAFLISHLVLTVKINFPPCFDCYPNYSTLLCMCGIISAHFVSTAILIGKPRTNCHAHHSTFFWLVSSRCCDWYLVDPPCPQGRTLFWLYPGATVSQFMYELGLLWTYVQSRRWSQQSTISKLRSSGICYLYSSSSKAVLGAHAFCDSSC